MVSERRNHDVRSHSTHRNRRHRIARPSRAQPNAGQRHRHRRRHASSGSASRMVPDLLRLTPSVAVATSGPAGSLTEVRIRGAEANHTLLFIDGIRANDPAAGNDAALRAAQRRPRLADRSRARPAVGAVGVGSDRRRGCGRRREPKPCHVRPSARAGSLRLSAGRRHARVQRWAADAGFRGAAGQRMRRHR